MFFYYSLLCKRLFFNPGFLSERATTMLIYTSSEKYQPFVNNIFRLSKIFSLISWSNLFIISYWRSRTQQLIIVIPISFLVHIYTVYTCVCITILLYMIIIYAVSLYKYCNNICALVYYNYVM